MWLVALCSALVSVYCGFLMRFLLTMDQYEATLFWCVIGVAQPAVLAALVTGVMQVKLYEDDKDDPIMVKVKTCDHD